MRVVLDEQHADAQQRAVERGAQRRDVRERACREQQRTVDAHAEFAEFAREVQADQAAVGVFLADEAQLRHGCRTAPRDVDGFARGGGGDAGAQRVRGGGECAKQRRPVGGEHGRSDGACDRIGGRHGDPRRQRPDDGRERQAGGERGPEHDRIGGETQRCRDGRRRSAQGRARLVEHDGGAVRTRGGKQLAQQRGVLRRR